MFNILDVSSRADQALVKNQSNPEESRQIYLEEIMDWSDNYTENNLALSTSKEAKDALTSIVNLWIAYCAMEISLRQFKQAVKIFEDAISDPVASRSADMYLAYVDYCKTRGKPSNAQKVYIKGLSSALAQEEADKLWGSFLPFIQSQGSPSLSMQQLYEAVTSEAGVGVNNLTPPGALAMQQQDGEAVEVVIKIENSSDSVINNESEPLFDESSSRMAVKGSLVESESKSDEPNAASFVEPDDPVASVAQEIVVSDPIVSPGGVGDDLDSVVGMTPEQLTRMYQHRPPMLFSAPNMEPTVFGLSVLSAKETLELELFLGVSLSSIQYGERQNKVDAYLDLVEGLWTAQALKERHFDSWFTDLKKLHEKEGRDLSRACEEKEKEAVGASLVDSVKEKNQVDRKRFRSRCAVQREVLHAVVNKTIYSLLMDQQRALVAAEFPRFSPSVVERIQSAMAALKSGVSTTVTPAVSGQPANSFEPSLLEEIAVQKKFVCALLSLRVNLAPPPSYRSGTGSGAGRRDSQEEGADMRRSSVGSDYYSGGQNGRSDYYSQDSKLQRKAKRRKVYSADGSDEIRFDDRRVRPDTAPAFEARRQGGGGSGGVGYQGPEHLRRGPKRGVRGPAGRDAGGQQFNAPQSLKGPAPGPVPVPFENKGDEPAPINLLQKLATMIQKVKK